jgi:hypothetical protein
LFILFLGQNALLSEDVTIGKKGEYEFDETDFLGLDFFEKKRYKGPPPGLAPAFEPLTDDDFPEVEIIIGDRSKFEKSRGSTEIQPANEADKVDRSPPSTVIEPEEDEDVYKPTVRSWGMFPRPQNISKAVRYSCSISQIVIVSFLPSRLRIFLLHNSFGVILNYN